MIDASSFGPTCAKQVSTLSKLIRSKATKSFLTKDGLWTNNVENAAHFHDRSLALAAARKFHLSEEEVELYYLFNEHTPTQYDFTLPLM